MSCVATAVCAILQYYGHSAALEEVSGWCGEDSSGCSLDQIEERLDSCGIFIERWTRDFETKLRETVDDPTGPYPVIVTIQPSRFNSGTTDHAVVIVGIGTPGANDADEERIYFMDPLSGQIGNEEYDSFGRKWESGGQRAFFIDPPQVL